MPDDIVKRARERAEYLRKHGMEKAAEECDACADEIHDLREKLAEAQRTGEHEFREIRRLVRERDDACEECRELEEERFKAQRDSDQAQRRLGKLREALVQVVDLIEEEIDDADVRAAYLIATTTLAATEPEEEK